MKLTQEQILRMASAHAFERWLDYSDKYRNSNFEDVESKIYRDMFYDMYKELESMVEEINGLKSL